jgi:alpha-beta hydrolase superfamily lysophospholipase
LESRCDVGVVAAGEPAYGLDFEVFAPPAGVAPLAVMFCIPGGGLTKAYYSLEVEGAAQYHWARAMADRGLVVVNIDPLGVDEAARPADGYTLRLEMMALANARATAEIRRRLDRGAIPGVAPCAGLPVVGLGSSMGGAIATISQAKHGSYDALALLGAHPNGDAAQLPEPILATADGDAAGMPDRLAAVLRELGRDPYAPMKAGPRTKRVFGGGDSAAVAALRTARASVLTMPGISVMVPGGWRDAAAAVTVPVFLAFGERDFWEHPQDAVGYLTACHDVTLAILPQTGHTHLVFPSVAELQRRVARWVRGLAASAPSTDETNDSGAELECEF